MRDTNECISYLFTQFSLKVIILVSVSFSQQNSLQCQRGEQGYWLRFNFFMHDLIRDQITLVSTLHLNFLEIFRPVNHPLPIWGGWIYLAAISTFYGRLSRIQISLRSLCRIWTFLSDLGGVIRKGKRYICVWKRYVKLTRDGCFGSDLLDSVTFHPMDVKDNHEGSIAFGHEKVRE